jgi:hypothetical protein
MPWDEEPAPTDVNRLIIALRTSPGVMHYAGTEAMHLVPGFVTWVNQRVPHCTINLGETNSIHLIVDTRRKEAS